MKRIILSLAIVLAAAACAGSPAPTEPGDARFDGVIGSGTVTGGGGAPGDSTARGGGTIGSGT
jgi:hypothetical protein